MNQQPCTKCQSFGHQAEDHYGRCNSSLLKELGEHLVPWSDGGWSPPSAFYRDPVVIGGLMVALGECDSGAYEIAIGVNGVRVTAWVAPEQAEEDFVLVRKRMALKVTAALEAFRDKNREALAG